MTVWFYGLFILSSDLGRRDLKSFTGRLMHSIKNLLIIICVIVIAENFVGFKLENIGCDVEKWAEILANGGTLDEQPEK